MGSEIISTIERRRSWPTEEKLRIMGEALAAGATASAVADRNGVCRSLLYTWLRLAREGRLPGITVNPQQPAASFVPVRIAAAQSAAAKVSSSLPAPIDAGRPASASQSPPARPSSLPRGRRASLVEVALSNGRVIKVDETIDPEALARLVAVLDDRARQRPDGGSS